MVFFYLPRLFRIWTVVAHYNPLYIVALSNLFPLCRASRYSIHHACTQARHVREPIPSPAFLVLDMRFE